MNGGDSERLLESHRLQLMNNVVINVNPIWRQAIHFLPLTEWW
jgi:hypothetical protein